MTFRSIIQNKGETKALASHNRILFGDKRVIAAPHKP